MKEVRVSNVRLIGRLVLIGFVVLFGLSLAYLTLQIANAAALRQGETPQEIEATDLQIQVQAVPQSVRPSEYLTFTLIYTNTKTIAVANVRINNTLSAGQIYGGQYTSSPLIPTGNFTYTGTDQNGYTLIWNIPTLAAGSSGTIIFATQVLTVPEPNIEEDVIILGSAATISSQTDPVSSGSGNDASIVVGPLLSIKKTAAPTSVLPGRLLTYTLTVKNENMDGSNPRPDVIAATNLVITDVFSLNTSFVSATAGGVYSSSLNAVVWKLAYLNPGASQELKFTVRVTDQIDSNQTIKNYAADMHVISAELYQAVEALKGVTTDIDSVLQKTVIDRDGGSVSIYPTEFVTYTFTVYNPLNTPLSGVWVTDTLPGTPLPLIFIRSLPGCSAPSLVNGGRDVVWQIDLPAWGATSCSFVVQTPATINFPGESTNISLKNALQATHPATYFCAENDLASVKVNAPLIMSKSVAPTHVQPGETVTYTIVLNNRGPFLISGIRITDTLEGDFHFLSMVEGPPPEPAFSYDPVVWSNLSVLPGQQYTLRFRAYADGYWLVTYYNNLIAYSPAADIPDLIHVAGVKIDSPILYSKNVSPSQVFLGETVHYEVAEYNRSDVPWLMSRFEDILPVGFLESGTGEDSVVFFFSPAYSIPPGGSWSGSFDAQVVNINCNDLPKTYYNLAGNIRVTFISPLNVTVYNANNAAPVTVNPNIQVDLIPQPKTVQRGGVVTYTLHLDNVSPYPAQNGTVAVTLPANFSYIATLSGPPPTSVSPGSPVALTWQNLTVWGNSDSSIVFTVRASTSDGVKTPSFSGAASGVCYGKLGSGAHPLGNGKVTVVQYVVSMTKKPAITQLAPLSLVDYTLTFDNLDSYPILLDRITDTMPSDFHFISVVQGLPPTLVQGNRVIWQNILMPSGKTTWKIRLQSGTLYGSYSNQIAAHSPTTGIQPVISQAVQVLPLFDLKKDVGVTLVQPGALIPYTITLLNLSQVQYLNVYITDTLPAGLTFYRMRVGYPQPLQVGVNGNQPVWLIPSINANGASVRIAFEARSNVFMPPGVYYNQVIGSSQSGSVPGPISTAPFTILETFFRILLPFVRH